MLVLLHNYILANHLLLTIDFPYSPCVQSSPPVKFHSNELLLLLLLLLLAQVTYNQVQPLRINYLASIAIEVSKH